MSVRLGQARGIAMRPSTPVVVVVVGALPSVWDAPPSEPVPGAVVGAVAGDLATVVVVVVAGEVLVVAGAVLVVATAPNGNGGRVTGTGIGTTGDDVLAMGGWVVVVVSAGARSGSRCSPGRTPSPEIVATSRPWLSGCTGPEVRWPPPQPAPTATTSNAGTNPDPTTWAIRTGQLPGVSNDGIRHQGPEQRCAQGTPATPRAANHRTGAELGHRDVGRFRPSLGGRRVQLCRRRWWCGGPSTTKRSAGSVPLTGGDGPG